jgi:hypothetical protein
LGCTPRVIYQLDSKLDSWQGQISSILQPTKQQTIQLQRSEKLVFLSIFQLFLQYLPSFTSRFTIFSPDLRHSLRFSPHITWIPHGFPPVLPPFFHRANRRCSRPRPRRLPRQQLPQLCGGGLRRSEALLDGLQEMRQDVHLGDLISTVDGTAMAILWYFDVVYLVTGGWYPLVMSK